MQYFLKWYNIKSYSEGSIFPLSSQLLQTTMIGIPKLFSKTEGGNYISYYNYFSSCKFSY